MSKRHLTAVLLALAASGGGAWAAFTSNYVASFHGAPCTEYSAFESFTQANLLPNYPDDPATTSPDTALVQLTPGAIITPQGNIDNLVLPPSFELTDSVPSDLQEVVFQLCILLNQFDWTSVVLEYTDAGGTVRTIVPDSSQQLVFLMGREERVIRWDLSGLPDVITTYRLRFRANLPSTTLDALKLDTRYACTPGVVFCAGDGSSAACPCANGLPGRGCENSFSTGGGLLAATGTADVANDTLVLIASALPPSTTVLFFQGDAPQSGGSGVPFGDGVRCVGGNIVRLGLKNTAGGAASYGHGVGTDPDISVRGAVPTGGATRYYQGWYRNSAAFCTSAPFNLTNGLRIDWS